MFNTTYKKIMEVNAYEVIDVVRLLGQFGMKFTISAEYSKVDDIDTTRKERFREIVVYGTRKQLREFLDTREAIINYHLH